jgi:hypothetical protein
MQHCLSGAAKQAFKNTARRDGFNVWRVLVLKMNFQTGHYRGGNECFSPINVNKGCDEYISCIQVNVQAWWPRVVKMAELPKFDGEKETKLETAASDVIANIDAILTNEPNNFVGEADPDVSDAESTASSWVAAGEL